MNELTTTNPNTPARADWYRPDSISEAYRTAKALVSSNLLPNSIRTPEAALAIIMTGAELGLTPMQSCRSIHVIDGKPCLSADLIVGLVKRSAACEFFRLVESTEAVATYETLRKGEPQPTVMSFTIEQAEKARLTQRRGPWQTYPAAMLRARAATSLARAVYPDVVGGIYETDEAHDVAPAAAAEVIPERIIEGEAIRHDTLLEAVQALDCAPWIRERLESAVTAQHFSWLEGCGDGRDSDLRAAGYETYQQILDDIDAGKLRVKGIGPKTIAAITPQLRELAEYPPLVPAPYDPPEPIVPEVIDPDVIDAVEVDYKADPTQREYWTERASNSQGSPIVDCAAHAAELGFTSNAEAFTAWASRELKARARGEGYDQIGAVFAHAVNEYNKRQKATGGNDG